MQRDEGFFVAADGARLYWRSLGEGEPVVIPNGIYYLDDLEPLARGRRLVAYDPRHRGRSDAIDDPGRLGIDHDVQDLEAVRAALGRERVSVLGHSYVGLLVGLYATRRPERVERLVLIGPLQADAGKQYPPDLRGDDATAAAIFARLADLQRATAGLDAVARCERLWSVLRELYVEDPQHAERIRWGRCELPNERGFLQYWMNVLLPSIQRLVLRAEDFARVTCPALVVHGRRDRSAPYGGGVDWAAALPAARLLTVENAGHAPWLEAPEVVLPALAAFLGA